MKRKLRFLLREVRRLEGISGFVCLNRESSEAGIRFTFANVAAGTKASLLIGRHDFRRSESSIAVTLNHRFAAVKKLLVSTKSNRVAVQEVAR